MRTGLWLALVVPLSLGGCEGFHLYNGQKDTLAKQAKDTYAKVDVLSLTKVDRDNAEKLRDEEIIAARNGLRVLRDQLFFAAVKFDRDKIFEFDLDTLTCSTQSQNEENRLDCYIGRRLKELGFMSYVQLGAVTSHELHQDMLKVLAADDRADLEQLGWKPAPVCGAVPDKLPDKIANDPKISAEAKAALDLNRKSLIAVCDQAITQAVNNVPGGDIKKARDTVAEYQASLAAIAKGEKDARDELNTLTEEYKKLLEAPGENADARKAEIIKRIKELRDGINAAGEVGTKIGVQIGADEDAIESIDTLLAAAGGETVDANTLKDNPELAKAVLVVQALPGMTAEASAAYDAYKAPPTAGLLIAKQQAMINVDYLSKRKAQIQAQADASARRLAALVSEASSLSQALQGGIQSSDCQKKQTEAAKKALCEQYLLSGYDALSRSILRGRGNAAAAAIDLEHISQLQAINAMEYALRSWDNLVGPPVDLVAAYHAGGLKPETLANFLTGLAATGIFAVLLGG